MSKCLSHSRTVAAMSMKVVTRSNPRNRFPSWINQVDLIILSLKELSAESRTMTTMEPRKPFRSGWNCHKIENLFQSMHGLRNGKMMNNLKELLSLPFLKRPETALTMQQKSLGARELVHFETEVLTPITWGQPTIPLVSQDQALYRLQLPPRLKVSGDHTMLSKEMFQEKESYQPMQRDTEEATMKMHTEWKAHPSDLILHLDMLLQCHLLMTLLGTLQLSATMSSTVSKENRESTWSIRKFSRSIKSSMRSLK